MRNFRGITVDPSKQTVIVQSGVRGVELLEAVHKQGFETVIGSCPTVGVAGFTMGGGHSDFLSTKYGIAASNVLEALVMLHDGRIVRATR